MNIKECIDQVDNVKPNQYTIEDKVEWLSYLDGTIINDVLKTHEGYDGRYDEFEDYSPDKLAASLIVQSPYDRLYTAYLKMKIDEENGETARYNNSATMFNAYMTEFKKYYNKTHMPLGNQHKKVSIPCGKHPSNVTDAQLENLKREITKQIMEYLYEATSEDRIAGVVNDYVYSHVDELKGANGYTPVKGVDYRDGIDGQNGLDGTGVYEIKQRTINNGEAICIEIVLTDGRSKKFVLQNGTGGVDGGSAYDIWLSLGNEGTEEDFIESLKGKDGHTPVKGVDYTDGNDGYTPQKNIDYFDGKDGASVSIVSVSESSADGGNNVVTFSDGKTLTVKNGSSGARGPQGEQGEQGEKGDPGAAGENGKDGEDGYTPVKGKDYFTEADKQEIVTALAPYVDTHNSDAAAHADIRKEISQLSSEIANLKGGIAEVAELVGGDA